jgi:hypothetical protein
MGLTAYLAHSSAWGRRLPAPLPGATIQSSRMLRGKRTWRCGSRAWCGGIASGRFARAAVGPQRRVNEDAHDLHGWISRAGSPDNRCDQNQKDNETPSWLGHAKNAVRRGSELPIRNRARRLGLGQPTKKVATRSRTRTHRVDIAALRDLGPRAPATERADLAFTYLLEFVYNCCMQDLQN